MRIAVIGGGTAGLTCAYLLHRQHEVTVFEAASDLDDGTQTACIRVGGAYHQIDLSTGVFDARNFPSFFKLLTELEVVLKPADMSFSVSDPQTDLEYGWGSYNRLFAKRRNLLSPPFWGMLLDAHRFHRESHEDYQSGRIAEQLTLRDYFGLCRYGRRFIEHYVVPMSAAIYPQGPGDPLGLSLLEFIRRFRHPLLPTAGQQAPWFRLAAGAPSYLAALTRGFRSRIRLNSPVKGVVRDRFGVTLNSRSGAERFDKVIFACRGDLALGLLERPSIAEQLVLGAPAFSYEEVVLHTDTRLLPRRRHAWAGWNYRLDGADGQPAGLTCNLNRLQRIEASETLCLSVNQTARIDPQRILARHALVRPNFGAAAERMKPGVDDVQGNNHSYFCSSWLGHGQHEDAVAGARRVAAAIATLGERHPRRLDRHPNLASVSKLPLRGVLHS